jgi:hypothetical protein
LNLDKFENWDRIEKESAYFILEQGEKKLKETIETASIVTSKAVFILQISLGLMVSLVGYVSVTTDRGLAFQLSILLIILSICLFVGSLSVYDLYEVRPLGNTPSNLIDERKISDSRQELAFLYSAIYTVETSINFNERKNTLRAERLSTVFTVINIAVWTIVIYSVVIFLLDHLFRP